MRSLVSDLYHLALAPGVQPTDDIDASYNSTGLDVGESLAGIFQLPGLALLFDKALPYLNISGSHWFSRP